MNLNDLGNLLAKKKSRNQLDEASASFAQKSKTKMTDIFDEPYFVGIAASAGGLEAVSLLVQNLPKEANAIYIIAQHMSPTHKSLLTSLISRETMLNVEELKTRTKPKPDTIYVTPPNKDVVVKKGVLNLQDPKGHPATPKPSADRLFESLASDQGEKSVAVILSGTGSDGSYGVQSVREAGGITIAQDSKSAKYDGMPSAALETGTIDLTLTPMQIGQHLGKILASPRNLDSLRHLNDAPTRHADLMRILQARTGVNFGDYKENTINRRIARRMVALGVESYEDYVQICRENVDEAKALYRDLLISVTRFFRDPKQFQQLDKIIQELVESREGGPFRIWVAGCATGEEAYSVAILFAKAMGGIDKLAKSRIQVFASDIDERALDVGRQGVYPVSAANDIPKEFVDEYFDLHGNALRVKQAIRNVVLFSVHNMAEDAPFINVDLVSLRNVLIYFNSDLQERVLNRVHYSLNATGTLFLGTSETVGVLQNQFETIDGQDKIFQKRMIRPDEKINYDQKSSYFSNRALTKKSITDRGGQTLDTFLFNALARAVAPDGFITTKSNQIVRVFGDISDVVQVSEDSTLQLSTRILATGLRDEASSLVSVTLKHQEFRVGRWHKIRNGAENRVRLRAFPIASPKGGEDHVLFAIERRAEEKFNLVVEDLPDGGQRNYIRQMEADMESTREALQQTIEELQTANEELQSVNEEMQSTNEELEATNEELETSNEELQSTNEELITVNEEMQINFAELQVLSSELAAILDNAAYPLLIVDAALVIRRASEPAKKLFGIQEMPTAGLHLGQCCFPEGFPQILSICSDCLNTREPMHVTVADEDQIYSMNIMPYSDKQESILGLEISLSPIGAAFAASRELANVMDDMANIGHWQVDLKAGTQHWSDQVFHIHGMDPKIDAQPNLVESRAFYLEADRKNIKKVVEKARKTKGSYEFDATIKRKDGIYLPVRSYGRFVTDETGEAAFMVGAFCDISDEIRNQSLAYQFEEIQNRLGIGFFSLDIRNNKPFWSAKLFDILGYDPKSHDPSVQSGLDIIHEEDRDRVSSQLEKAISKGAKMNYEARMLRSDGAVLPCRCYASTLRDVHGDVSHVYGYFQVIEE